VLSSQVIHVVIVSVLDNSISYIYNSISYIYMVQQGGSDTVVIAEQLKNLVGTTYMYIRAVPAMQSLSHLDQQILEAHLRQQRAQLRLR
jgi:hypothetical protein